MRTVLLAILLTVATLFASDAEDVASQLRGQVLETKGYFIQFDKTDAYGWAYVATDGSYVFKLDGMSDAGEFLWTPLHQASSPSFESIYVTSSGHEIWFGPLVQNPSASTEILSQLEDIHFSTAGLFFQYDTSDPFGWVYMTENEKGLYKLEGLNTETGTLEWLTVYNSAYVTQSSPLRSAQNYLDKVAKGVGAKQGLASGDGSNKFTFLLSPKYLVAELFHIAEFTPFTMRNSNGTTADFANDDFDVKVTSHGNSGPQNVNIQFSDSDVGIIHARCDAAGVFSIYASVGTLSAESLLVCLGTGDVNKDGDVSGPVTLHVKDSAEYKLSYKHYSGEDMFKEVKIPNDPKLIHWSAFGAMSITEEGIGTCLREGDAGIHAVIWDENIKDVKDADGYLDVKCIAEKVPEVPVEPTKKVVTVRTSPATSVCKKGDTVHAYVYAFTSEGDNLYASGSNISSSVSMSNQNPQTATATLNSRGDAFDISCDEEGTAYFFGEISLKFAPELTTRSSNTYYFYHLVTVTTEDKITGATCNATTDNTYTVKEEYILDAQRWDNCGEQSAFLELLSMYKVDEAAFNGVSSGAILKHNTNDEGTGGCAMEVVCY